MTQASKDLKDFIMVSQNIVHHSTFPHCKSPVWPGPKSEISLDSLWIIAKYVLYYIGKLQIK